MPSFWLFLAMLVPTGLALLTLNTAANSVVQLGPAPDMRGRVMGLYMLVFLGGAPLGSPLVGWVAEQFGPRMSLLAGGVISAAAAVVIGLLLARRSSERPRLCAVRSWPDGCLSQPAADWPGSEGASPEPRPAAREVLRMTYAVVRRGGHPGEVAGELERAVAPLRAAWPGLRWTRREAWHITLAFLGEVE